MEYTQPAQYLGSADNAYALVALLSAGTKQQILSLLDSLKDEIGEGLWTMPSDALHVTLCEIIQPKPYSQDKQLLYEANARKYENVPAEILRQFRPIEVHFNKIEVSPQAIIIRGEDDGSFNKIRQQLVEKMPLPKETKFPPDIVHTSIARFTKPLELERIKGIVANHAFDCVETVNEFKLVNNLAPPLLSYRTVRTYRLES